MSNPIADTADYFARWQRQGSHYDSQLEDDQQQEEQEIVDTSLTDIRAQWHRVLNRLSFLNPNTATPTIYSDEDESIIDRDTFELIRNNNRHYSSIQGANTETAKTGENEEEKLPSAYELDEAIVEEERQEEEASSSKSNYFTHPFNTTEEELQTPEPASLRSRNQGVQYQQDNILKDKWDKTLDKLKLIANLQSSSSSTVNDMPGPSHTLATYYPPAFDPLFSAFTRDEYGRKLVSQLSLFIYFIPNNSYFLATYFVTMYLCHCHRF